jgi:MFS family permease
MSDTTDKRLGLRVIATVAGAAAGNFISSQPVLIGTFGVFLLPVSQAIGWTRTGFSALLLLLSGIGLLGYPLAGRLADRWDARSVLIVGNVLFGATVFAFCWFRPNAWVTGAIFAAAGLTSCLSSVVVLNKLLSERISANRGLAFGLTAGSGVSLGYILLPLIAQHAISTDGWRFAYQLLAVLILVVGQTAFWLLVPRRRPINAARAVASTSAGGSGRTALASPILWLIVAAMCVASAAISALIAHNVAMAADRSVRPEVAVLMLSAGAAANALWQPVAGGFLDRVRRPRLIAPFMALAVVGLYRVATATSVSGFLLGGVLVGVASGSEYGFVPIALRRYFGEAAFAEIYGVVFAASIVSHTTGPMLLAATYDATGSYKLGLNVMACALGLAAAIVFFLPAFRDVEELFPWSQKEAA